MISDKDKQYLLSLTPSDITKTLILDLFSDRSEKVNGKMKVIPAKMNPNDTFYLEKGEYFNKEKVLTNCGLFIINKLLVERDFIDVLGYLNNPINNKELKRIEGVLSDALTDDVITTEQYGVFLNRVQWFALGLNSAFASSFTMGTIKPNKQVTDFRDKVVEKNKAKLDAGDVITAAKTESEVLTKARDTLKGDPGMALYDSGARGSFDNAYKNNSVIRGPVYNPSIDKWEFVNKSFVEGLDKKDIAVMANTIVTSELPKRIWALM